MPSIIVITFTDPGRVYGKMNPESIVQPKCKCKVGLCLLCGSSCKRCGCACDGIEPAVALARTTGQRGPLKRSLTNSAAERDHSEREAAKRARIEISKSVELEGTNTDPTMKQPLQNINDLWERLDGVRERRRSSLMKNLGYQTSHLKKLVDQDGAPWCKAFSQQQLEVLKFCILLTRTLPPSRSCK